MRFESVRAHPFGPFDDDTLALVPGLNVVYGTNEAGKSTWHAALYAGLCGMRRRKGGLSAEDKRFRDRHRPWDDNGEWAVSAVVALEDGLRVELHHDLANRVNSSAVDADLAGRDYAGRITYEGAPDGSRWLGLNRRSFLGVACVRQAQILGLLDDAGALQEDLQRAAATAGADETAARALELLATYRKEQVGSEHAPKKPLRTSRERVDAALSALERTREAQAHYLARRRDVEQLAREAQALEEEAAALRAARAAEAAEDAERRAGHAAELPALFPAGPPRSAAAGSGPRTAAVVHAAAPYVAAAAVAAGVALALTDFSLPGLLTGAPGLGYLAWWWLSKRRAAAAAAEGRRLLGELRAEAGRLRDEAVALAEPVDPSALQAARGAAPDRLEAAEHEARRARDACHTARGRIEQLAGDVPNMADAEDELAAARSELGRVEKLDRTLARTIEFLERAEERVHRNVAPVLRATVLEWLPRVTGGRYTDCKVDPESLQVDVRNGHGPWRRAALLSHGAAEQIYLLLRLALSRHLVAPGEVCPLILDDVVAACDVERKRTVLETLQAVGAETQVILFTHEEDVRAWARQRLSAPRDALTELPRPR
ncbi:MAG: AAA family ATPase [Acidobacteria bacterium]|nr:AAA family ATPase [Acidobacteriota bacterium]MYK90448.1 AAA family ATPase [Acidobacteriota bacterium]